MMRTARALAPDEVEAGVALARNAAILGCVAFALGAAVLALSVLPLVRRRARACAA